MTRSTSDGPQKTAAAQEHLATRLGDLLQVDDVAESILEYLLTIDDPKEILDYISQLLGHSDSTAVAFVDDLCSFQRGEYVPPPPNPPAVSKSSTDQVNSTNNKLPLNTEREHETPTSQPTSGTKAMGKKPVTTTALDQSGEGPQRSGATHRKKAKEAAVSPSDGKPAIITTKGVVSHHQVTKGKQSKQQQQQQQQQQQPPISSETQQTVPVKPKPLPSKGKAARVCGCFGTNHPALTNCLFCGRVACQEEGYTFCPFCGYQLSPVKRPDNHDAASLAAWELKERLLQYQRDGQRQTRIMEDHSAEPSTTSPWLTQEERRAAIQQEEERRNRMLKREAMQMNVSL